MIEQIRIQEELERASETEACRADAEILGDMWAHPSEVTEAARERMDARRIAAIEQAGRRYQLDLEAYRLRNGVCCEMHGESCEQGGDECCRLCTEAYHFAINHGGLPCVLPNMGRWTG